MGKPFGKASRRTFIRNGTPHSLTSWISPKVKTSDHIKISKRPPSEALKGGLPMAGMQLQGHQSCGDDGPDRLSHLQQMAASALHHHRFIVVDSFFSSPDKPESFCPLLSLSKKTLTK